MKSGNNPVSVDKDKDAVWVANLGQYRMAHGLREKVVFDPGTPVRIKMDAWIESQAPILVVVEDPFGELPASPVVDPTPLVSQKDGKPVTGVGTGPAGSGNADDARETAEKKAAAADKGSTKK